MMRRLFKPFLFLLVAGFVALVGYAYFGDLSPEKTDLSEPVLLNVD